MNTITKQQRQAQELIFQQIDKDYKDSPKIASIIKRATKGYFDMAEDLFKCAELGTQFLTANQLLRLIDDKIMDCNIEPRLKELKSESKTVLLIKYFGVDKITDSLREICEYDIKQGIAEIIHQYQFGMDLIKDYNLKFIYPREEKYREKAEGKAFNKYDYIW